MNKHFGLKRLHTYIAGITSAFALASISYAEQKPETSWADLINKAPTLKHNQPSATYDSYYLKHAKDNTDQSLLYAGLYAARLSDNAHNKITDLWLEYLTSDQSTSTLPLTNLYAEHIPEDRRKDFSAVLIERLKEEPYFLSSFAFENIAPHIHSDHAETLSEIILAYVENNPLAGLNNVNVYAPYIAETHKAAFDTLITKASKDFETPSL